MDFLNNPEYKAEFTSNGHTFYVPADLTQYHNSRVLAMESQHRYAMCGINRDVLNEFADKLLELANKENSVPSLKTDIGIIANNLKFRMTQYVDELAAIRMGAIACFIEGEDPNRVVEVFTTNKLKLAGQYPEVYAFFFNWGVQFIPEYRKVLLGSMAEDYFQMREINLRGLTPASTLKT